MAIHSGVVSPQVPQSQLNSATPRISAKEFARYSFANPKKKRSILRRQKFKRGEGVFRMQYYSSAIKAIREYLLQGRKFRVLQEAIAKLSSELPSVKRLQRTKLEYNISAIKQYYALYGKRNFEILPTPRLKFVRGKVTVGAQPDLYVREGSELLIIKFDFCKTPEDERFVPLMLQIIRDAARIKGLKVKARNIIVFDIAARKEHPCPTSRAGLKNLVAKLCDEIHSSWDSIQPSE